MRRATMLSLSVLTLLALAAGPAQAVPPAHDELVISNVVEDSGEACGFPVRWEIEIQARRTLYFDQDGAVTRVHIQAREDNTITNLDTGLTLREGPDAFIQRTIFEDDGTVTIETAGLSVLVQAGADSVMDTGRFVVTIGPGGVVLLHSAGQHEPRLLSVDGGIEGVLAAFCDVLA